MNHHNQSKGKNQRKTSYNWPVLIAEFLRFKYRIYQDILAAKVYKKVQGKPWMRYKELRIIEKILKNLKPTRCLEWGAGYSTIYFSRFLDKKTSWISIEHEIEWAKKIKDLNQNTGVKINHIAPNQFPWTDNHNDGSYSDLKEYIEFPTKSDKFEFILIDGRARTDCLIKAYELITEGGIVVLHDANRKYYHEPFKLYAYQALFKDARVDAGGLWVGSRGIEIGDVVDVRKHKMLWERYNALSKKGIGFNWAKVI
jgi:predicted O-methyltransferase YrrM